MTVYPNSGIIGCKGKSSFVFSLCDKT